MPPRNRNSQSDESGNPQPRQTQIQLLEGQVYRLAINPEEFRIPSTNPHDHSSRIQCRVQPGHARQIDTILSSKLFPYREKSDLLRHAIYRHLVWLESLLPEGAVPSVVRQVDAIVEILREEEYYRDFSKIFEDLAEQVNRYQTAKQLGRAQSLIARVMAKVNQMPDSTWKDEYQTELQQRFGHLLDVGKMDLTGKVIEVDGEKEGEQE